MRASARGAHFYFYRTFWSVKMILYCVIDREPIPQDRLKRKGLAAACCKQECYDELRKRNKKRKRAYRFGDGDRALLLRLRRTKFTISDWPAFISWWQMHRRLNIPAG